METIKETKLDDQRYLLINKGLEGENVTKKSKEQLDAEEHAYKKMCSDLPLYQDKIKRDKNLYKEEFNKFMEVFTPKFYAFLESPSSLNENMKEVLVFLAHLGHIFPKKLAFIPGELIKLLEHSHSIIHPDVRLAIIDSFNLLRKKDLVDAKDILPLLFQLLTCQDKALRQKLQEVIITDLGRINEKCKNYKLNTFIRNKCIEMLDNPNYKAARKTLNIMILLYKKKVWDDDKSINDIARACCNDDRKIAYSACKFFLSEYEEVDDNDSENNEMEDLKNKYKLLGKGNNKKTKKKKLDLRKLMKAVDRREGRKEKNKENKSFMPIDLLKDPSSICEKLFNRVEHVKNRKNYSLKLVLLRLIGRLMGRHKIVIPRFFAYIATLIKPKQEELSTIFASVVEATHHLVPPSDLYSVLNEIYDKFIDTSFPPQYVTIGVNGLREIVERSPNCITYDQYTAVEDLKKVKNKSVSMAVKSFLNMVRDVNPGLIDNKVNEEDKYGYDQANDTIEGVDLLKAYEGLPQNYKLECNQLLSDVQLKKLRLLKLKENAEAVQRIRLNLTNSDIKEMMGEQVTKAEKRKDKLENKNQRKSKKKTEEDDEEENKEEDYDEDYAIEGDEDEEEDDDDISQLDEDEELEELSDDEGNEDNEDDDVENEDDMSVLSDNSEAESYHSEDSITNKTKKIKDELDEMLDSDTNSVSVEDDDEKDNSFVEDDMFNTYKLTRREQLDKSRYQDKEPFKLKRKKKTSGQKTNFEARKNKPTQMIIHKVKKEEVRKNDRNLTYKIKNVKRQLGRLKRGNMILNKKGQDNKKTKKKLTKNNKSKMTKK